MSDIVFNKPYSMSEMCELTNQKYDPSHSKNNLIELEKSYIIERKSRYKYCFIRELSAEEKLEAIVYGKYKQLLRPIIITTLAKKTDNRVQRRMKEYLNMFGIVNDNYAPYTWSNRNLALLEHIWNIDLDEQKVDDFISEADPMLKRMVKDIWEEMAHDDLIEMIEHPYFVERIIFEDQITKKRSYRRYSHKCNNDEREWLMSTKKEVATEMGYNNSNEVPFVRRNEFSSKVAQRLNILYYYDEYELILNREWLGRSEYCLEDISLHLKLINEQIIRKLLTSKQGKLKRLSEPDRLKCIDTIIDINTGKITLYDEEYED